MAKREIKRCSFCDNPYIYWITLKMNKNSEYGKLTFKFWICNYCDKLVAKLDWLDIIDYNLNTREKLIEFIEQSKKKTEECKVKEKFDQVSAASKEAGANYNLKMDCYKHNTSYNENYRTPKAHKPKANDYLEGGNQND